MALTSLLYLEIDLFAIAVLLLLFFSRKQSRSMPLDEKLFDYLLLSIVLVLVFDGGMWLIDGKQFSLARNLNLLITTCYYLTTVLVCYAWILYCDYKLFGDEVRLRKRTLLYNIPMFFCVVMSLTSPFTGSVFVVDQWNIYHRGPWFWPVSLVSLSYLVIGGVLTFIRARSAETRAEKRECFALAMYMVAPLVGGVLQAFFYGLSLVWVCTVVSAIMLYSYVQNLQISTDALTGINNRRRFDKYLDGKVKSPDIAGKLFVVMIDVDDFKSINDTYGHSAGDTALTQVADLLKHACSSRNDFLARIGGDEFSMVCQRNSEAELQETIDGIQAGLDAFNASKKAPYTLALIGYAACDAKGGQSVDALVSEADTCMYREKARHKQMLAAQRNATQA